MRRKWLRTTLLIVVTAALVGIGYQVLTSVRATRHRTPRSIEIDLPAVAQHIMDFRRVKTKQGKPVWEVKAAEARYFDDQDAIVVRAPEVTFFFEDGRRRATLSGAEGRLQLAGQELESVTVQGEVRLTLDDLEFRTAQASYERDRDLISAPGAVTITGKALDVEAEGMEVLVTPQQVRLLANVQTVLRLDVAGS
jgi:LPS export ABC transporter protein LptC